MPDSPTPRRTGDTAELIFQRLVEAIVEGSLPAGQPLRESRLASEWGVSRTPIREAVRRASALGLVALRPNQRPLVRTLMPADVQGLYEVRALLEARALELAAPRLPLSELKKLANQIDSLRKNRSTSTLLRQALAVDETLHMIWIRHCENPWLQFSLGQIWTFIRIFQHRVARGKRLAENALEEHATIVQALLEGKRSQAIQRLREHLSASASLASQVLPH